MKTKNIMSILVLILVLPLNIQAQKEMKKNKKQAEVNIATNMHCTSCKNKLETELGFEKGVKEVKADLTTNSINIIYNPRKSSPEDFVARIQKTGYQAKIIIQNCENKNESQKNKKNTKCCNKEEEK